MYFVYILRSKTTGKHYIGSTYNVDKRLVAHNSGANRSTRAGMPWEIIYSESYASRSEAWQREKLIKRYKGGEAFRKLIS